MVAASVITHDYTTVSTPSGMVAVVRHDPRDTRVNNNFPPTTYDDHRQATSEMGHAAVQQTCELPAAMMQLLTEVRELGFW